jgi:hypothetical protein
LIEPDRLRGLAPFLPAGIVIAGWVLWSHFEGGYFPQTWYPSAIAAVGLLLATAIGTGRIVPPSRSAQVALASFAGLVAWAFLSLIWSGSPGTGWDSANKLLLYLLVAWILVLAPWTPAAARVALGAWTVGTVAVCAVSLLGATGGGSLSAYFLEGRYLDPIGYSNGVSALPLMALFPALWLAARRDAAILTRVFFLAAVVFLAEFSLLPQSRGAVLGFAVAIVVFVALSPDRLRLIPPLFVLAAAIAVSVVPIYHVYSVGIESAEAAEAGKIPVGLDLRSALEDAAQTMALTTDAAAAIGLVLALLDRTVRPSQAAIKRARRGLGFAIGGVAVAGVIVAAVNAGSIAAEVSDRWQTFKSARDTPATTGARLTANYSDQRYDYWRVAFEQFERTPVVGAGAGSYEAIYSAHRRFDKPSKYVHDIWLRFLEEGGILGAAFLAVFLGACAAGLVVAHRRLSSQGRGIIAVCAAVSVYFFVHASFDWLEEFPALAAPALALPLIGTVLDRAGAAPVVRSKPIARYATAFAVGLLALACLGSLTLPYLAQRHLNRGAEIGLSDIHAARQELDRAAALDPLSSAPYLRAATILVAAGDRRGARREFRESLDIENNWYAHFELALLDAQAGRERAALVEMARARVLDSHDPFIEEAFARIRRGARINPAAFNSHIRRVEAQRFIRPSS